MLPARRILPNDVELSNSVQRRWLDLARWLRSFIYSEILNLGNREATEARLNQIADDASSFYAQYYSPEVGTSAGTIYRNYFAHVKGLIEAYKNNDIALIQQQRYAMYKDSYDLSKLFSQMNRYWDQATLQALFNVLVDNTEKQIQYIINGNYEEEILAYDQYVDQIYRIADEITYGLLGNLTSQDKFSSESPSWSSESEPSVAPMVRC